MDPSITDREEKETAADGVVASGEGAIRAVRDYCACAECLTWRLKILRRLVSHELFVVELLELLERFDTEYVRNPEPKVQLIMALEEYPKEEVRVAIEPFLLVVNEKVRFHAVGATFAMEEPQAATSLAGALSDEESLRVKNRIAAGLAQRGWTVPDTARGALPDGFTLRDGKVIASPS
jgi:HEAT repeat protein